MGYADNQYRWVAVLNRKVPVPQLLNALSHLAVGMRSQCRDEAGGRFHDYVGPDGSLFGAISNWPVIVLQATSGNQLRTLRAAAHAAGLPCQVFVDTMVGKSADDQMRRTGTADESTLEYYAVFLFGKAEELQGLVKKFSLFTQPPDTYGRVFHTLDPH